MDYHTKEIADILMQFYAEVCRQNDLPAPGEEEILYLIQSKGIQVIEENLDNNNMDFFQEVYFTLLHKLLMCKQMFKESDEGGLELGVNRDGEIVYWLTEKVTGKKSVKVGSLK